MNQIAAPEAAAVQKTSTLAEQAYRAIKRDIISGTLEPGRALRLEFLKARYELSFSPLREALNRLHSERLVESEALKGFRVATLSLKEMHDSMRTRILIDCDALGRSIERGNAEWEAHIVGCLHTLSWVTRQPVSDDAFEAHYDQVEQRHLALHQALIAACDSRWLLDFSMTLYVQTERYRRPMLVNLFRTNAPRDVSKEHRDLVDATLSRDTTNAVALLQAHYRKTAELIEVSLAPTGQVKT
ncbi:GntR family transcriptional regulator [Neopusillimonas maritima]|uniref:GntR family transcriptional regulator n=1 Tax=Neopusillimonas maritima TaxID=2026239 RepID=A0A3A1YV49_9BURK|nr:GntR family transcriptional regulator [Neopusillimonas maritima]RIY41425.1 GntR family transcriptional regulator [Neopusillimonas maritima]